MKKLLALALVSVFARARAAENNSPNPSLTAVEQQIVAAAKEKSSFKFAHTGAHASGLFNRTGQSAAVELKWSNLGFKSAPKVRDLWLRKDLAKSKMFAAEIPAHGCVLLRVR